MSDNQTLLLPVAGMMPDYGPFTTAPSGALEDAQNVQLRTPGVIEPRGSFVYSVDSSIAADNETSACFSTPDGLHTFAVYTDGSGNQTAFRYNGTDTVTGSPSADPLFTRGCVHSAYAAKNTYFTSDRGVYALRYSASGPTYGTCRYAGMPRPPNVAMGGYTSGTVAWLGAGNVTGYRAVYVKVVPQPGSMADYSYVYGPPSGLTSMNGDFFSSVVLVRLDTTALEAGDLVQIYRSVTKVLGPSLPSDEMRLRTTITLTSTDITNKYVTFVDNLADSEWSGAALYTNATQQTISQASWRPGYSQDIAAYNGMMFYGGMRSRQRQVLTAKSFGSTASAGETLQFADISGTVANGNTTVTGVSAADIAKVYVGQLVTGPSANFLPATYVTSVGATSFTISNGALGTGVVGIRVNDVITVVPSDGPLSGQSLRLAVGGLSGYGAGGPQIGNFDYVNYGPGAASNVFSALFGGGFSSTTDSGIRLYVDFTNSTNGQLGAQFFFEHSMVDGAAFTVRSSKPLAWDKYVDNTTGVVSGLDYYGGNYFTSAYLFFSKMYQPEAVPLENFVVIGDEREPICRIIATRDCLWVFKTDGLWRVSGTDPKNLRVDSFDPTLRMLPNTPAAHGLVTRFDNDVYAVLTKGVYKITDGGAQPVDNGIRQLMLFEGWGMADTLASLTWAIADNVNRFIAFSLYQSSYQDLQKIYIYWPDSGNWTYWKPLVAISAAGGQGFDFQYFFAQPLFGHAKGKATYRWLPLAFLRSTLTSELGAWVNGLLTADNVPDHSSIGIIGGFGPDYQYEWTNAMGLILEPGDAVAGSPDAGVSWEPYYVQSADATNVVLDRPLVDPLGIMYVYKAFQTRVMWSANPGAGLGVDTHFEKVTFAFDRVYSGESFTYEFQGYKTPTLVSTDGEPYSENDAANVRTTPNGTYGVLTPRALIEQRAVPKNGPRRDWALKAGFKTKQAGQYFRINGCALHWSAIGTKVTR